MADIEQGRNAAPEAAFHTMSVEAVAQMFSVDITKGLTTQEAKMRFERDGPNELTEKKKRTIWERIWDQINNVLVFILFVVAVVSAIKGATSTGDEAITSWIEVGLILGVIILNTWIGIRQEGSAEKSADALKAMLSSDATVLRDNTLSTVPARELVVGDIVELATGDRIPADLRLFKVSNLASQEAALTGESLPVEKITTVIEAENPASVPLGDRKNLCFSATLISQGQGRGIVMRKGDDTEIGQINNLVSKVEKKKTNVLVQIDIVSRWIAVFVIFTAIITFLVAFFYTLAEEEEFVDDKTKRGLESVSIALVTAVAMIPEGLAAIVTLTYAWAVSNMAKHNAIVRVLPAVETLGSVTVICSDKTGTLTMNLMSMVAFVTSNGRFKVDTTTDKRDPSTIVRDDKYMNEAKSAANGKKAPAPAASPADDAGAVDASAVAPVQEPEAESAVKNGQSPDVNFVRSMLATGILCSKSELGKDGGREGEIGNPTEISIVRAAYKAGVDHTGLRNLQPIVAEVPFSSEYKFMATVHNAKTEIDGTDEGLVVHVKGAVDRLIPLTKDQATGGSVTATEPVNKNYWLDEAEAMSSHGLRVLALCRAMLPADSVKQDDALDAAFVNGRAEPWLTIVGLACILDPPRPECVDAIKEAHGAGVRVAMITGDHKATALAIGGMLNIVDAKHPSAVTGPELDAMSDDELRVAVMSHNIFARASPENKIRIVKALQAEGQVSSMTGDGVNDAPALKAADMGVAMGKEGTDVAREAAEMILADDNFATIVRAVREGRVVWDNLRKVLLFNTPVNNAQGMTVLFGMICGLPYTPLTPIQVLYCNLICAVTLGFVLAVEPAEDGIMTQPPRRVGKRLIGRYLLFRIAFGTVVLVAFTVGAVFWVFNMDYEQDKVRAQASNTLTISAISIMLSARFSYNSGFHMRLFTGNKYAWYAAAITLILQICITYIPGLNDLVFQMGPMDGTQWGICLLFVFLTFCCMEAEKAIMRHLKSRKFDTDDDNAAGQYFVAADTATPADADFRTDSQRSAAMSKNLLHK